MVGAAALTGALTAPALASSWEYGTGQGSTAIAAHSAAVTDLISTWRGCSMFSSVSDTFEGNGTWYAVEKAWCAGPI
jgi:hypothetical protein